MSSRIKQVLHLAALGIAFVATHAQAGMSTPGQFAVSPGGGATYNIPIQVPPSVGGVEPKLSLNYNSQTGNGLLGVGWSLGGLSSITRCPRTMAQDGVRGGVNYDNNDRFCLDGQRLIALPNQMDGADGAEYRTELDGFARIVSYGRAGGGPMLFKVWTKSGQIMEYGNTVDSRVEAQGKEAVRTWALNRLQDTKGNYLTVVYVENNATGEHVPKWIYYTGNSATGTASINAVEFQYDPRVDEMLFFQTGAAIRIWARINNINVYSGNKAVRSYKISYLNSPTTRRSTINAIQECSPTTGECKPQISVSWSSWGGNGFNNSARWADTYGVSGGWVNNDVYPRHVVDINSDGLPDIVGFANDGVYVSLNAKNSFGTLVRWSEMYDVNSGWVDGTLPRYVVDVNGDGLPDIVGFGNVGVHVALNEGNRFGPDSLWTTAYGKNSGWSDNDRYPRSVVDVNGDGLPDIVGFANDGVYVALNTGSSFTTPVRWSEMYDINSGWIDGTLPRYVVDVNGDGLPDIVGFGNVGVHVALNEGNRFGPDSLWTTAYGKNSGWSDNDRYPRSVVDVNGDGLPDIVGFANDGVYVSLNTGSRFDAPARWSETFDLSSDWLNQSRLPRYVVDVNGDGLSDIVGFGNAGVHVALNEGNRFGPDSLWNGEYGINAGWSDNNRYPRSIVDVNGDGLPDIVGFAGSGVYVTLTSQVFPDLVSKIQDGLGNVTTYSYQPLTSPSVYTKDAGSNASGYPKLDLQTPMYVVSSVTSTNGVGGSLTTSYQYGGLKAEVGTGRGLLGFRWMKSVQQESGISSYSEFRQDYPYTGLPSLAKKTIAGGGNNGLLNQINTDYGCLDPATGEACTVAPGHRYFPYAKVGTETSWDLDGSALPTIITASQYDDWGNATQISVNSSDGYSKTTVNSYAPADTANWYLGRLTKATVTSTAP